MNAGIKIVAKLSSSDTSLCKLYFFLFEVFYHNNCGNDLFSSVELSGQIIIIYYNGYSYYNSYIYYKYLQLIIIVIS